MRHFSKSILLATVALLGGLHTATASVAQLGDNQTASLPTYGWYASRGAGQQQNGEYKLQGLNNYSHDTITAYLKPGAKYELSGKAFASAAGKGVVGVILYDKNWTVLSDLTSPLPATLSDFHLDFTVPSNGINTVVYLAGDRKTSMTETVQNIQLQKVVDDKKLHYAPPKLVNPITIELGNGFTSNTLSKTQDYIIKLPKVKKIGSTYLIGGHNIVIVGGWITIPTTTDLSNTAPSRGIYIKDNTGIVHIEGVLIDGSGGAQSDGIDTMSPNTTLQVENVRVDGIYGFYDQFHADVIQTFGGVKDLRVDKLTGYSGYQGLQIDYDAGPTGSAEISRVNLVSTGTQIWSDPKQGINHNNGGTLIWLTPMDNCKANYPITFQDVYVQPRAVRNLGMSVWPPTNDAVCPSVVNADGSVSFPHLPVTGVVKNGAPPSGDYVPSGVAGVNYVSPGYIGQ
jgi:hypothetical protein